MILNNNEDSSMKKYNHKYKIYMFSSAHSAFDGQIFYREAKTLVKAGYKLYLIISHDKDNIDSMQIVLLIVFLKIDNLKNKNI